VTTPARTRIAWCISTSEDGTDGSIDAAEIERIARKKVLLEG
jgi:hypothetical protein